MKYFLVIGCSLIALPSGFVLLYNFLPPPLTPLMVLRWIEDDVPINKEWVPLEHIALSLRQSVIAAEDNLFCQHSGFDWKSLEGSIEKTLAGKQARGASTVSMQTSKNLFLWPSRSFIRKALEGYLTLHLEFWLDKPRILELYLNIAEWGDGIYGAEAAAQKYFGKSASKLSSYEASVLAATLPNPRVLNPSDPNQDVTRKAKIYRKRILQLGPLLSCVGE